MRCIKRLAGVSLAVLLASAAPVMAQDAGAPNAAAVERARQLESQAAQNPNPAILWYLAEAWLAAGDKTTTAEVLTRLADKKAGFAPPRRSVFDAQASDPILGPVIARMRSEALQPGGEAVATVTHPGLVPEGLARDPANGRLLIGDMAGKRILAVGPDGAVSEFATGLDLRPLGLTVEPGSRRLWVATTDAFWDAPTKMGALLAFDLDTGAQVKAIGPGEAKSLNDLSFAPNGDLYITDPAGGSLFLLRKDGDALERVTPAGGMQYPNGVAVSGDGKIVYVAQGLTLRRVDAATGALTPIPTPVELSVPYVDGLYWRDGELIAVQNSGMDRIVRMRLDAAGEKIESYEVLAAGAPLDAPTTGALAEDAFYVIGNAQLDRLQGDGTIAGPVAPIRLLRFPLT
jgi:sugar lactone lactonase YvrE